MTRIPWALLKKEFPSLNEDTCGVGMIFIPDDDSVEKQAKAIYEKVAEAEGFNVIGWRDVPIDVTYVGEIAKANMPRFRQIMVESKSGLTGKNLERALFIVRKLVEKERDATFDADTAFDFATCTLSNQTIVYKGMLNSASVGPFFKDLTNPDFVTNFAIYHRRFSTNTNPRWPLAQPFRVLGHNGEINTLQGNINWVASRQAGLKSQVWEGKESALLPLCSASESDSSNLDHLAELLVRTGRDPTEALMILVPEAYMNHPDLVANYPEVEDFYKYWEGMQEGWDGPALLVFSDGEKVGARLDRNGLRPARFWRTADDMIYVASEVGVLGDVFDNAANVVAKGRLGPGQMICADMINGTFKENTQIAKDVAGAAPYSEWVSSTSRTLESLNATSVLDECQMDSSSCIKLQSAVGYGLEDQQMIIEAMAMTGAEPTYCMGDDVPLSVLASTPHMLYDYFKQRFAQVTNPPIDPLREGLVMSLGMRLGGRGNLLEAGPGAYNQIQLTSPILLESELAAIANDSSLKTQTLSTVYKASGKGSMKAALEKLCADAEAAAKNGCGCIILSDKDIKSLSSPDMPPIPPLLAVGAVHHHLIRTGVRTDTSIVVETSQCFSTHHIAMLVGYGAHAICPYLGFESCRQWRASSRTANLIKSGKVPDLSASKATKNYKKALEKGLLKILSKMGISLLSCYHGAQIFEVYGLGKEVIDFAFKGSVSRIGGMSLDDLAEENERFWAKGFPETDLTKLDDYGFIQSRPKGEYHANNQAMAKLLHKAIGMGGKGIGPQEAYDAYLKHFEDSPVHVLRDMLELKSDKAPISVDEVESVSDIMARFCTGGMSLGAISRETHETIAIAMNRIGGKSNSGEGGEDPVRWETLSNVDAEGKSETLPHLNGLKNGDVATSRIKQVASGRFGVTPEFLVNAEQLEIKVAQGAKPGEGGQLPGKKVSPYIAGMRRSKPGVPLISPPPHHDIYSIEDLAQLIYDLHQINKAAKVSVKLVAQAGIGTVASGVAKANADVIQVSGHDGGTGASPISSIKHCGGPVEMGLAEVHQTLTANGLRERVSLRVDGGMRTGRDVLVTAALGGDEFGFGTIAMIATGCIMARVCHTNNCPVGVASQREELRARFPGVPEDLVNYFLFVANEVRQGLASMGLRSLDELVGRGDYLQQRSTPLQKTTGLDLSFLTQYAGPTGSSMKRILQEAHDNGPQLDDEILADPAVLAAIESNGTVTKDAEIINVDRSSLARIGGAVALKHGDRGFKGQININLRGSAGQSFGCFLAGGIDVKLVGEANDYVGKGMAGGVIAIVPPEASTFAPENASIVGNTCLYGSTGGKLFVLGRAGERFAVRNSACEAVVEGCGDHALEYMTGGVVVVLSNNVGRNVGAGMTGGLGYFYDDSDAFLEKINGEIVSVQRIQTEAGKTQLRNLIQEHFDRTGSKKAKAILDSFDTEWSKFWQVVPPSEANTPEATDVNAAEAMAMAA
jgi:glutamate synthase (ferredoxin)